MESCTRANEEGLLSKRGGRWHPTTVARLLSREAREKARQQSAAARAARKEQQRRERAAALTNTTPRQPDPPQPRYRKQVIDTMVDALPHVADYSASAAAPGLVVEVLAGDPGPPSSR